MLIFYVAQISLLIRKNTWAVILSAIFFSFIIPQAGHYLKPYLNCLLGILMFLSCLDLKIQEIIDSFSDLSTQIKTLFIVHLVSPFIIYLLRDYFSPEIFLGLIIASVIPAGRSAVFLSNIYGGIPVKALVVTSISNILSPLVVPALVWLFAHQTLNIDALAMGTTIFWMVLIPLIIAYLFGKTNYGRRLNLLSPTISTLIVFLIILGIISPIKDVIIENPRLTLILILTVSLLVIINFALGFFLKRDLPNQITYGLSSSYKNYTLGTLLSLTLFTPLVALPSIVYTIVNNLLLVPLQFLLEHHHHPPHIKHKHRNLSLLAVGLIATYILSQSPYFHLLINSLGLRFGYLSAFIAGMLFTSTFTVTIGGLILLNLGNSLPTFPLILTAVLGAVIIDSLVFKFVRHQAETQTLSIFEKINHRSRLYKLLHTPFFSWSISVLGILIMASPLPDELGISLLGLSQIRLGRFFFISFMSHSFGMFLLLLAGNIF